MQFSSNDPINFAISLQKATQGASPADAVPTIPSPPVVLDRVPSRYREDLRPRRLYCCGGDPALPYPGVLHVDADGGIAAVPAVRASDELLLHALHVEDVHTKLG
ncbi:hypothetical protein PoB_005366900 [Plakobranchus ocellatus]|uniref:Uncharacterized protein n=1 Tax=Plakobranchus ocellatus TaxID=259542 RepID=A0AAV4C8X4_9GAST|nr:hypothetical protein PoB_005366900 [Plakobranchus ocellatus]